MLLGLGGLLGPPDQPRFQGGGGGHEDLPVQPVALGALHRQGYGVGFLFGGAGVLVHLVQKQIPDGGGGQVRRAVGAGEVNGHPVKPLGQVLALVGPVLGRQGRAALEHGLQLGLHRPLGQLVGRVHHHGGARVLVDGAAQGVFHGRGTAHLGGLHKDDLLGGVVREGVHDLHQVRGQGVPPGARHRVGVGQDPVGLGPGRHRQPLFGPQYLEGRGHPPGDGVELHLGPALHGGSSSSRLSWMWAAATKASNRPSSSCCRSFFMARAAAPSR